MPINKLKTFLLSAWSLGPTPADKWALFWRQTKNVRVRLGVGQYHPQEVYTVRTKYGRLHFRDNFGDITNLANILYGRAYHLTKLQAPGVIIDIGANIGMAALWFAHHNPDRVIYCFEPLAPNVEMVRLNCPHAHVQQIAVGAAPGEMTLQVDADSVMASHHVDYDWSTQAATFPVQTLDALAAEHGLDEIALIKMDTEGMELEIFAGGAETFRRAAQVAMETHGQERHRESLRLLREAGFTVDSETFDGETGMIFATRY